ncbi:uncharacterized protein LOC124443782 [Xenia sp. Carnegie-2017]|uniref:uncharacterized protein LOC124443782 n=1 Tax=Xenia sp. Carnegie-2017 TaxID=2897299 RepID=UPI001F04F301|nr:uncharacterized protein LOC124443782 [Xenia sp. Carnegie-2017]
MLNHLPFCFLKRKRSETDDKAEGSKNASKQEIVPYKPSAKLTEKKEGLLVRAFRRIKRRLVGDCPPSVAAICLYKTPGNGRKQCRYKMTPQLTEKQSFDSLLPRSYVLNAFVDVRESRNFEFKTGGGSYPVSVLPEHIRKYGSAFLNCDGGILIAGVLDNGQIRGYIVMAIWKIEY